MININFMRKWLCGLAVKHGWRTLYEICDCQRYEPVEPPTVTVRLCMDSFSLANEYCPNTEFRQFDDGYEPTIFCSIHKTPEYIWLDVCLRSGLLPNPYCQEVEKKRFEKSNEPRETCEICEKSTVERSNLPVSLELYAAIPSYVRSRDDVFWDEHIHRIREETHIERVTSFAYTVEDNGVWNSFTPWALSGNTYNLAVWNEVYFERVQKLAEIFNRRGVLLIPVLMPGAYGETPYRRNTNGVANEWTKEALPFQNSFHGRLLRILRNVYGERSLWCRLSNEVSRMGSWLDDIRTVTHRHEAWHRHIQDLVPIQRTISDSSHSDFTLLTETHLYVRLKNGEEKMIPESMAEDYDIEEVIELWGDNAWGRLSRPELHGINPQKLDESVEGGPTLWETVRGCGWKRFVMSTDGNTWGSGEWYIGGTYRNMSKEQLRELARFFWKTEGPKYEMNIIIAEHPKEVHFRNANNIIEENYALLNFDRLKAFWEVYSS